MRTKSRRRRWTVSYTHLDVYKRQAFEKSVLLFSEDIKRREAETLSHTDIVLPFRELPQEHTRFPNLSFTTYAVEDDRADFTARGLAALPGGDAGREGMRFELLCLGLIGRVCVPGLSKKQVEPLLGAASCLCLLYTSRCV